MNIRHGIPQAARLLLLAFLLLTEEWIVEARGGSGGGGRGSSGSRSSSRSSSNSRSSSSSSYGSGISYRSSSSGGGYGRSSSYGSSSRGFSGRYFGNTIIVSRSHTYYGGGRSVFTPSHAPYRYDVFDNPSTVLPNHSESPTITTASIKEVIIPGKIPSKEIFDLEDNPYRQRLYESDNVMENLRSSKDNIKTLLLESSNRFSLLTKENKNEDELKREKLLRESEQDEEVTIKDEKKAVIVKSMAYFWGDENLPRTTNPMLKNASPQLARVVPASLDCAYFSAINGAEKYEVCGIARLQRCQKNLTEVLTLGRRLGGMITRGYDTIEKVIIKKANGDNTDQFAWFCPATEKCCEWDCCLTVEKDYEEFEKPDEDFVATVHIIAFVSLCAVVFGLCYWCSKKEKSVGTDQTSRQQSLELVPIVADYPKQQRSNPEFPPLRETSERGATNAGGNIGWNVKPVSAP